jgi:peptidoglycan/LPS O-acetylase OafA/YrhL
MTKKLDSLTGLRGILAGLVVFVHARFLLEWHCDNKVIDSILKCLGHFGVSGFFILSGFILLYTYNSRKWETRSFFVNRFARIYPLYIFSILITLPIDLLSPGLRDDHKFAVFMLHMGTLQSWFEFSRGQFNSPSWTISVESFFYLMFPICFYLNKNYNKSFRIFTTLVAIFTCWNWNNFGHQHPSNRLAEFLIGMWLFDIIQSKLIPTRGNTWFATFFLLIGLCGHHLLGLSEYEYIWIPIFASLVILCLAKADLNGEPVWGSPKWILAGEISYGLYLLHAPVQRYTRQAYKMIMGESIQVATLWMQVSYIIVTSILSVIFSYFVWKCLEVPARNYLRKLFS